MARKGSDLPHADLADAWRAANAPTHVVHLDAAGSSLPSQATLAAVVGHLQREAAVGGYEAEVEAAPAVAQVHERLADLVGRAPDEVALVESGTQAFARLLAAWPLLPGARVATVASEYGSNRMALQAWRDELDLDVVDLPVDADGRLDFDGLDRALAGGVDLVAFPHVASHRGVVQPAAEAATRCRAAGVPLLLDVAQSAGQVDLAGIDADAWVGTSRKWLRGPRGVGWLAVRRDRVNGLRPPLPNLYTADWALEGEPPVAFDGAAGLALGGEAPIAARVGLATTLDELAAAGIGRVGERVAALGRLARHRLDGVGGWQVQEPLDEPSGIVTLAHDTLDPVLAQRALLSAGVLTVAIPVRRAPADLTRPVLRASFHAWCTDADVDHLADALEVVGPTLPPWS